MSNSTPKRGPFGLISKFLRSGSGESSSYSSLEEGEEGQEEGQEVGGVQASLASDDAPISPLALMNENSPEAWLGQFLIELGLETRRGTLQGAKMDADLLRGLSEARAASGAGTPLAMLDTEKAAKLRAENWATWWKSQDSLAKYCYSTLALSMLGNREYASEVVEMYRQSANSRIKRDAHYVLCHMLGKDWPRYEVTEADLARLSSPA